MATLHKQGKAKRLLSMQSERLHFIFCSSSSPESTVVAPAPSEILCAVPVSQSLIVNAVQGSLPENYPILGNPTVSTLSSDSVNPRLLVKTVVDKNTVTNFIFNTIYVVSNLSIPFSHDSINGVLLSSTISDTRTSYTIEAVHKLGSTFNFNSVTDARNFILVLDL